MHIYHCKLKDFTHCLWLVDEDDDDDNDDDDDDEVDVDGDVKVDDQSSAIIKCMQLRAGHNSTTTCE